MMIVLLRLILDITTLQKRLLIRANFMIVLLRLIIYLLMDYNVN